MPDSFETILKCLKCKGGLSEQMSTSNAAGSTVLKCSCGSEYPVINDVPRFLSERTKDAQSTHSLTSFNFQYGKESWIFDYDIERAKAILKNVFEISQAEIQDKTVCVIGCGNGCEVFVLNSLSPKYIVGIDLTDSIEDAARNNKSNSDVFIIQADALNPPLSPKTFEVLYCDGVIPHTKYPLDFLRGILELLKPGGTAYIRTLIDEGTLRSRLQVLPRNIFRSFSKRLPSGLWWKLCYLIGVLVKVPILGKLLVKFVFYSDPENNSVRVTQLKNFRFYGNHQYRHRLRKQDILEVIKTVLPAARVSIQGSVIKIVAQPE